MEAVGLFVSRFLVRAYLTSFVCSVLALHCNLEQVKSHLADPTVSLGK